MLFKPVNCRYLGDVLIKNYEKKACLSLFQKTCDLYLDIA